MTDQLGPDFDERLGAELDHFVGPTPRPEGARFSQATARYRRFGGRKTALVAAAALALLMVGASAFSGTADPAAWVTSVQTVTHVSASSPSPVVPQASPQVQAQPPAPAKAAPSAKPARQSPEPEGDPRAEPSDSPEPPESPDPSSSTQPPHGSPSPDSEDGQWRSGSSHRSD
jgi:hypothetical protein